jgi:hypothetical protein
MIKMEGNDDMSYTKGNLTSPNIAIKEEDAWRQLLSDCASLRIPLGINTSTALITILDLVTELIIRIKVKLSGFVMQAPRGRGSIARIYSRLRH